MALRRRGGSHGNHIACARGAAGRARLRRFALGAAAWPTPGAGVSAAGCDDGPVTDPYLGDPTGDLPEPPEPPPVITPRALTLAISMVATTLLIAAAAVLPLPYAVSTPGPTLDTLGDLEGHPLITVEGAETYPSGGELRLTTVAVAGGQRVPVSLLTMVRGWLDSSRAVRPVEEVIPPDRTREEIDEANQAAMISSQEHATVAALEELGYEVPTTMTIGETLDGTGADGVVLPGDVITHLNGRALVSFADLSAAMDELAPGDVARLTVLRDDAQIDVDVTTVDGGDGRALLGVLVDPTFDLPVQVEIDIDNIGGPSAGLMFALGIVHVLTEVDETGGARIAGSGTIDLTGEVGPIGGIAQKMVGARRDGMEWFLAPEANCAEVTRIPAGLNVVAVGTLAEARAAVEAIGTGDGEGLRTCAALNAAG